MIQPVGTWLSPMAGESSGHSGLWVHSVLDSCPLSTLTPGRRSLSTGHVQLHSDQSQQNQNRGCLHVGSAWAECTNQFIVSVLLEVGCDRRQSMEKSIKQELSRNCLPRACLLFLFHDWFCFSFLLVDANDNHKKFSIVFLFTP